MRHVTGSNKYSGLNKALVSISRKNQMGIELGIGIDHLNWEIKHMAPLEPMIVRLVSAIDMIPRWGKNYLKRCSFAKPATTLSGYFKLCSWIPAQAPIESNSQVFLLIPK